MRYESEGAGRRATFALIVFVVAASACAFGVAAVRAAEEPLSFSFLDEPPGVRIRIGDTRLHLHCRGGPDGAEDASASARATVVFESGLGGSALEWSPIADAIAPRARVCSYDRAGYGWSDPAPGSRDARRLAHELERLLDAGGVDGPLLLVAHSFGGLVARLLVERGADVAALVLVDSSHEEQFTRLETPGGRPMVPRSGQFVISMNEPPASLPRALRRKVAAFGRMRKTYAATHGEMAAFRRSTEQVGAARASRGAPYPLPVTVILRGRDVYADVEGGAAKTATWIELQEDLATLGSPGRLVASADGGHHVHADDPALVIAEIERLLGGVASEREAAGGRGSAVADDTHADGERP